MYQVLASLFLPFFIAAAALLSWRLSQLRGRLAFSERLAEGRGAELKDYKQRVHGMRNQIQELNKRIAGLVEAKSAARSVVERLSKELDRSFAIGGYQVVRDNGTKVTPGFQETQPCNL